MTVAREFNVARGRGGSGSGPGPAACPGPVIYGPASQPGPRRPGAVPKGSGLPPDYTQCASSSSPSRLRDLPGRRSGTPPPRAIPSVFTLFVIFPSLSHARVAASSNETAWHWKFSDSELSGRRPKSESESHYLHLII